MEKRTYIEDCIRSTFQSYGYGEVQTPIFEYLELFTAKSGDTIIDEIYSFKDKGDRLLALRPELTAPVIRFFVNKLQMEPKPLKLFYFGDCFRYDRPQKGRYREFKQAGCELIGTNTPEAFAELIALGYKILNNVGLKNIVLKIGNLNILTEIFKEFKISKDNQKVLLPLIDKSQFDEIFSNLQIIGIDEKKSNEFLKIIKCSKINELKIILKNNKLIENEINVLSEVFKILESSYDINYEFDMGIVRGLDYYKGIVFEIDAPMLGAEKQLCGGGAYELIPLFGGRETPTSGFAIGFDRTILALEMEEYNFPLKKLDYYIIPVDETTINKSINIAQKLREKKISVDIDLLRRGIGKSLKYAGSLKVNKTIIIGPDEIKNNSVTIRDMKTGKQELVKISEFIKNS